MEMAPGGEMIRLRDYWAVLVRYRAWFWSATIVVTLSITGWVLFQPNIYQSTVTLMALGAARGGLSSARGEIGGLLPAASGSLFSRENPADRLLNVLQSRTLAVEVIQDLDLLPHLFPGRWDAETRQWKTPKAPTIQAAFLALKVSVALSADRKGIVTIVVSRTDPHWAAVIAKHYVEVLHRTVNNNAFSLARKNREFVASQLDKTRQALNIAEETLKNFEQTHQIVSLEAQTTAAVEAIAEIEGQIREREVRVGVQQRLMTSANREVYLLQEELHELRAQLTQLHSGTLPVRPETQASTIEPQIQLSLEEVPELKMAYARLQREALILGKVFTFLTQHLEQAKLDEAREDTTFHVLDQAFPAEKKSKPARTKTAILGLFLGLVVGAALVFLRNFSDQTLYTAGQVERHVGLELLTTVPMATSSRSQQGRETLSGDRAALPPAATPVVRYLYARFKSLQSQRQIHTVLLVGTESHDAVAALAVELAIAAAHTGLSTLLVDSNVSQPSLHSLLHCAAAPGVAEALATLDQWQDSIQKTSIACLHVVPTGTAFPATAAAFASSVFDTLLAQYKARYDLIVCLAPPILDSVDAALLGSKVDATCLVLTLGTSQMDKAIEAKALLQDVQADILGVILLSPQA